MRDEMGYGYPEFNGLTKINMFLVEDSVHE